MDTLTNTPHQELHAQNNFEQQFVDIQFWDMAAEVFDPIQRKTIERDALLDMLLQRPREAVLTEATTFAATYYADRLVATDSGGVRFFTRENGSKRLDSITTITESDGVETVHHTMFAPQTYGFDNPVEIIASSDGEFHIFETEYEGKLRGLGDMRIEVTGTKQAQDILREYFSSSLHAAREVKKRDIDQRAAADADAKSRYTSLKEDYYQYLRLT